MKDNRIAIRLNYPYHEDINSFALPLPKIFKAKHVSVLLFDQQNEYYDYLKVLCDFVADLECGLFSKYSKLNIEKLKFCKHYLAMLADYTAAPLEVACDPFIPPLLPGLDCAETATGKFTYGPDKYYFLK